MPHNPPNDKPADRKSPSPSTPVVDPTPHREGQTTPHQQGRLAPRLPHERDESADSQAASPDPITQQAHEDMVGGLQDTDRGPVMDELYENSVRSGATPQRSAPEKETPSSHPKAPNGS